VGDEGRRLTHHQCAVGEEDVVEGAVGDESTLVLLNHAGENRQTGRERSVAAEDTTATFLPVDARSVDDILHVGASEVQCPPVGHEVEGAGESERVEECRASCGNLVDIEAGVDEASSTLNDGVDVTAGDVAVLVRRTRERTGRREGHVLVSVSLVAARLIKLVDGVQEASVQREQIVIEVWSRILVVYNSVLDA